MKKGKRGRPKGSKKKKELNIKPKPLVKAKVGDKVLFEWLGDKEKGTIIEEATLYDGTFIYNCLKSNGMKYPIHINKIIKKM